MSNNDTLVGRVMCKTKMECALLQTFLHMNDARWSRGRSLSTIYHYDYSFDYIIYVIDKFHRVKWSVTIDKSEVSFNDYMARNKMVFGAIAKLKSKICPSLPR